MLPRLAAKLREGSIAWIAAHLLLDLAQIASSPREPLARLGARRRELAKQGARHLPQCWSALAGFLGRFFKSLLLTLLLVVCLFALGSIAHAVILASNPERSTMAAALDEPSCLRALELSRDPEPLRLAQAPSKHACARDASGSRLILSTPDGQDARDWLGDSGRQAAARSWLDRAGAPGARLEPAAPGPWVGMVLEALGAKPPSVASRSFAHKMLPDAPAGLPPFSLAALTTLGFLQAVLAWMAAMVFRKRETLWPAARGWAAQTLWPALAHPLGIIHGVWLFARSKAWRAIRWAGACALLVPVGAAMQAAIFHDPQGQRPGNFWAPASAADCSPLVGVDAVELSVGKPRAGCRREGSNWIALARPGRDLRSLGQERASSPPPSEAFLRESFPNIPPSSWRHAPAPSTWTASFEAVAQMAGAAIPGEASRGLAGDGKPVRLWAGAAWLALLGLVGAGVIFGAALTAKLAIKIIKQGRALSRQALAALRASPAFNARAQRRAFGHEAARCAPRPPRRPRL